MKCYKHHDEEAIGTCSKCGRTLCTKCTETTSGKLFCKECLESSQQQPSSLKVYRLTSALLGWLGALNTLLIGTYITITCLNLATLLPREDFLTQAYATACIAGILTLMLIYGSYLQLKKSAHTGGIINLTAGAVFLAMYLYFRWLSKPPFLAWLDFIGYFLPAPALAGGAFGILSKEKTP